MQIHKTIWCKNIWPDSLWVHIFLSIGCNRLCVITAIRADLNDERNKKSHHLGISLCYKHSLTCREKTIIIQLQHGPMSSHANNIIGEDDLDHRPVGIFDDGTHYYVYRFIFFADKFHQKSHSRMSPIYVVSTCFLSISNHKWSSIGMYRYWSWPSYIGPNITQHIIIDDILKGFIERTPSIDVFGLGIRIFPDPVVFFGDFVKMTSISNNMGHTASTFFKQCYIRKQNNTGAMRYIFQMLFILPGWDLFGTMKGWISFTHWMYRIPFGEIL